MSDLLEKTLKKAQEPALRYMHVSRRSFLKGALAVGAAVALAGCNTTTTDPTTAPDTTAPATTAPATTAPATSTAPNPPVTPVAEPVIKVPSYIIPEYTHCIGCKKCMVACSMKHYGTPDLHKSSIQIYNIDIKGGMLDIPILCMKCNDTPCVASCPPAVNALTVDEVTGAIIVDNNKCTACGNCVVACAEDRTGCLRISKDRMNLDGMCDLCGGDPECVNICSEDALIITPKNVDGKYWALNEKIVARQVAYVLYGIDNWDDYDARGVIHIWE